MEIDWETYKIGSVLFHKIYNIFPSVTSTYIYENDYDHYSIKYLDLNMN